MTLINLTGILRDTIDKLYDVLPSSNDYNKMIDSIYKELINPEGIYLNKLIKDNPELSSECVQFYRMVIILTMISDFYEYYSYPQYLENKTKIGKEIFNIINSNCDMKGGLELFYKNIKYAKEIIKTYTLYDINDKNKHIDNLIKNNHLGTVIRINPYILGEYANYVKSNIKEDKIIELLEQCLIDDDKEKYNFIARVDNELFEELNNNIKVKNIFIEKLNDLYNNDINNVNNAIRYIIYHVLNGLIVLTTNNLINKDTMTKILNITDLYYNKPEEITDEFYNNNEFSDAILDVFADIHYTYKGLIDFSHDDKVEQYIKRYNPFN